MHGVSVAVGNGGGKDGERKGGIEFGEKDGVGEEGGGEGRRE